jgi:hypothetical protein
MYLCEAKRCKDRFELFDIVKDRGTTCADDIVCLLAGNGVGERFYTSVLYEVEVEANYSPAPIVLRVEHRAV